jgi:putative peptidoglycan lipid II flippase
MNNAGAGQTDAAAPPVSARLARDSLIVGAATVLSRILGFVRDILIARALGAGPIADAFLVAFRLPNMFRRVLSEGGLNAPFVPVYLHARSEGGEGEARRFAGEAMANFAAVLLVLVALTEIIAPWLVLALAGGFREAPITFHLAQTYTRLALPFIAFTVLASLVAAILNAEKRFLIAALAPISLNVVVIGLLLWSGANEQTPYRTAKNLAMGVSVAGALHLVIVLWALGWKAPGLPRLRFGWSAPMRRLLLLGAPALLASATSQLVLLVATQIASAQPGAVSWLYYADRVFQMPLGFVAVAMGVVLLPEIAAREAANDAAGRRATVDSALALGLLLAVPAAVALAALAHPIVSVLFERGRFDAIDRVKTAAALQAFALGLPPAVVAKVLAQVYFAREKPVVPLVIGALSIGVAIFAGVTLSGGSPAVGAALAASCAFWAQALLLGLALVRDGLWAPSAPLVRRVGLGLLSAAVMGAAVSWAGAALADQLIGRGAGWRAFALLFGLCGAGVLLYGALAWLMGLLRLNLPAAAR